MMDLLEVTSQETQQHIRFSELDIIGQHCLEMLMLMLENVTLAKGALGDKPKQHDH